MELDLGGLPGPVGNHPGRDQPPARLEQRIVVTLPDRAGVLGAGLLPQGVQDGPQRLGGVPGQVTVQAARAAEPGPQPDLPVLEPRLPAVIIGAQAAADLGGQGLQVIQFRAAGGRGQQDQVRVVTGGHRQRVGPVTDLSRPRRRHRPGGQGVTHGPVGVEAPHPGHGGGGGRAGDPGLPPQPRPRRPATVISEPGLRVERRQHRRPGSHLHRRRPLQAPQALRLHHDRRGCQVSGRQPAQARQHHLHRLSGRPRPVIPAHASRRSRRHARPLTLLAQRDHLLANADNETSTRHRKDTQNRAGHEDQAASTTPAQQKRRATRPGQSPRTGSPTMPENLSATTSR